MREAEPLQRAMPGRESPKKGSSRWGKKGRVLAHTPLFIAVSKLLPLTMLINKILSRFTLYLSKVNHIVAIFRIWVRHLHQRRHCKRIVFE